MYQRPASKIDGFTLIELSIVLVIIGLVIGGVLVGKDMIRQSELRSIVTDSDRFKTAINTFRLKYNCLPGDCLNATEFFGAESSCPSGSTGTGTCNGNNDGHIDWMNESLRAWQQLGMAQLVAGTFSGVSPVKSRAEIGINSPSSRIGGVGYSVGYFEYSGSADISWRLSDTTASNRLSIGREHGSEATQGAFMSPREALALDKKYDDGKPGTGLLTVMPQGYNDVGFIGLCMEVYNNSAADPLSLYVNTDEIRCGIVYNLQF